MIASCLATLYNVAFLYYACLGEALTELLAIIDALPSNAPVFIYILLIQRSPEIATSLTFEIN